MQGMPPLSVFVNTLRLSLVVGSLTSCSLVTVPVETVGGVAKTTVATAGGVVEAPFKAAATRRSGRDSGYGYGAAGNPPPPAN